MLIDIVIKNEEFRELEKKDCNTPIIANQSTKVIK